MPMPAGTPKIAAAHHVLHLNTCSVDRRQGLLQSGSNRHEQETHPHFRANDITACAPTWGHHEGGMDDAQNDRSRPPEGSRLRTPGLTIR